MRRLSRAFIGLVLLLAGSFAAMFSLISSGPAEMGAGLVLVIVGTVMLLDGLL